ncbi:MAG: ATP-binding protein [Bacteroidetes bacterium]|nr:MAG: ATP-binding protein [Bacteroidota bacterium]
MALLPLSEEQVLDRLRQENPWWATGQVDEDYSKMQKRLYFDLFFPLVEDISIKRAVILMGPRRVGKTVMIYHAIDSLLRNGVSSHQIAYVSVENPFFNKMPLEQLFKTCIKATGKTEPKGWYVFFDEIQYLKDWEVHLKSLVDSYPYVKFVASGSAAAALKLKSNESGAGRFTDFMLPPLTFNEYIHLLQLQHLIIPTKIDWDGNATSFYSSTNIALLNEHFLKYINYGGYPEIIFSEKLQVNPSRFIKSDIIDKVLLRDLPSLYGIQDVQELNSLFTSIAYNSGQEFSLEALSQASGGVEKNTIKRYIQYLEAAFLIKIVHRIDNNAKRFRRANYFKIYLTNPSLRSALFTPMQATDKLMGAMVETAIYAQWLQREWFEPWYARWTNGRFQGEVDMVGLSPQNFKPLWALETKWSNRYFDNPGELKSIMNFCKSNNIKSALVTTIDKSGSKNMNELKLHFLPSALYAYTVGKNTIIKRQYLS